MNRRRTSGGRTLAASALVAAALADVACAEPPDTQRTPQQALELLDAVRDADFASWYAPRDSGVDPSTSAAPHGELSVVYVSPQLEEAAAAVLEVDQTPPEVWPVGSTAVSVGSTPDAPMDVSLLQISRRDEDGWTWAQYDARDRVLAFGRPGVCVGCHAAGDDFVFSVPFPDPP